MNRLAVFGSLNRSTVRLVGSSEVNDYIRTCTGIEATAKDFRTWHATVLAAASLAASDEPGDSTASRKRAVAGAMREVASYLGNTPAIARSSYVDPRVIDLYEDGTTIAALGVSGNVTVGVGGDLTVSGQSPAVLGAPDAALFVLVAGDDGVRPDVRE